MTNEQAVAQHAAHDLQQKSLLPDPAVPTGWENTAWVRPNLPREPFVLEDSDDPEDPIGPFAPEDWVISEHNVAYAHQEDGIVLALHVVNQVGGLLTVAQDEGDTKFFGIRILGGQELYIENPYL